MKNTAFHQSNVLRAALLGITLLGIGACAATPEEPPQALQSARATYAKASSSPEVRQHAATELHEAQQALQQAEDADSQEEQNHYAYLAERRAQIAMAVADRQVSEQRLAQLAEERDKVRLSAREAELAALEAKRTERGWVATLGDIVFRTNGAALRPGAVDSLDRLAEYLRAHPERTVLIEGHTDSVGSEEYNLELSRQRAESVRAALVGRGISPDRIRTVGRGETTPVAPNETSAGRQLNRRVEIVISDEAA